MIGACCGATSLTPDSLLRMVIKCGLVTPLITPLASPWAHRLPVVAKTKQAFASPPLQNGGLSSVRPARSGLWLAASSLTELMASSWRSNECAFSTWPIIGLPGLTLLTKATSGSFENLKIATASTFFCPLHFFGPPMAWTFHSCGAKRPIASGCHRPSARKART